MRSRVRIGQRLGIAAVLAVAAGLAVACRQGLIGQQASTLRLAVQADVMGIIPSPRTPGDTYTIHLNSNIFEGLVGLDADLRLVPGLAKRWENPDPRTWVFHLGEDRRFSDGRPVTAADVVASFRASRERGWLNRYFLRSIETVKAKDRWQVEITTRDPDPLLLTQLPWGFVLPADCAVKECWPPIGSGPYRLESRQPGHEIVLVRNSHHPGPPPDFDRVLIKVVADDRARVQTVLSGQADVADNVPLDDVNSLRERSDVKVMVRPGLFVLYLMMRVDRKPFSDPRLREAIELALDRPLLSKRALAGLAEPAYQVVPPTIAGFDPALPSPKVDRLRARELLARAGYAGGLSLRLDGSTDRYTGDEQILKEVARQLGEVGIKVDVHARPKAEYFPALDVEPMNFFMLGWSSDSGDAAGVLEAVFHTPDAQGSPGNSMGLSDRKLDELIDEALRSRTLTKRWEFLRRAIDRVAEIRPVVPLVVEPEGYAVSRRIQWEPPLNLAIRAVDFHRASGR